MMSVEAARPRKVRSSLSTSSSSDIFALRVLAAGDTSDAELTEVGRDSGHPFHSLENGVDGAVADRGVLHELAVGPADADGRRRSNAGAGRGVQADQGPVRGDVLDVLLDQDDQVLVVHFLLLVGQPP